MAAYPRKSDYPTPEMFPGAHFPPPFHNQGSSSEQPQMPARPPRYPEQSRYKESFPRQMNKNTKVEVCIRGDLWAIGFVVAAVEFVGKVTRMGGYQIRYIQPASGEWATDTFPSDKVRAYD